MARTHARTWSVAQNRATKPLSASFEAFAWANLLERALRWKRFRMRENGRLLLNISRGTTEISRSGVDPRLEPVWLFPGPGLN